MSDFAATSDDPSFAQLTELSKVVFSSLDAEEPVGVGEHALGRPGPGRDRAVDEGGGRPPVAHDRQPHVVPVVARSRPPSGGQHT
jgi:hypothetical protein